MLKPVSKYSLLAGFLCFWKPKSQAHFMPHFSTSKLSLDSGKNWTPGVFALHNFLVESKNYK